MNKRTASLAWLCLGLLVSTGPVVADAAPEPYPLDYWALREVINNAQVSPDGERLAIMKIPSKDGNPVIEVYDAGNLEKEPFRFNADPMEITNFYWASDEDIVFTLRQKVRDKIDGFNRGVYENRLAVVNVVKEKIRSFDEAGPAIESLLRYKEDKIIISFFEGDPDGPGAKLDAAFRPRAYWEFDLNRGTKKLLIRGKIALGNIDFDAEGNPILARGFDLKNGESVWYYREPGENSWHEIFRQSEDDFEAFAIFDKDEAKPGNLLVYANNGDDMVGLWSFNTSTKQFEELIYRRADGMGRLRCRNDTFTASKLDCRFEGAQLRY